ncbi:hypothetical protein FGO68_gene2015 [Halteria grandinella]|uniref:Uncharacterized protein n=1 Tax=Halteria grandinella TaxID=5974 RepID=A0A8J8N8Y2_HALGN|nr:hypothetical protein FGO68_gene2015 [Halteria grandinella]
MLIGIFVLAAFGKFETANDGAKYLAIGVAAATGILAIITQYATIREAEVLLTDLKRLDKPSELSKKIADSRHLLSLSAIAIVGLGVAVFALVVLAVLGQFHGQVHRYWRFRNDHCSTADCVRTSKQEQKEDDGKRRGLRVLASYLFLCADFDMKMAKTKAITIKAFSPNSITALSKAVSLLPV